MTALTVDEWARFRSYVPVELAPDDVPGTPGSVAIQKRVDALGAWHAAALEYLRARRAQILLNPTSFSVPEYSESWTANVSELSKMISELEALVPADEGGKGFAVGKVVRAGHHGWRGR